MTSGWVSNLPHSTLSAIRKEVPAFPIEHINRLGSMYLTEYHHAAEPPAKVKKRMSSIGLKAMSLHGEIDALSPEAKSALAGAAKRMGLNDLRLLTTALDILSNATGNAEIELRHLSAGRSTGAVASLVSRTASIMDGIGLEVDAKPRGDLVMIVESIVSAYGHSPTPVLKACQRLVDRMGNDAK